MTGPPLTLVRSGPTSGARAVESLRPRRNTPACRSAARLRSARCGRGHEQRRQRRRPASPASDRWPVRALPSLPAPSWDAEFFRIGTRAFLGGQHPYRPRPVPLRHPLNPARVGRAVVPPVPGVRRVRRETVAARRARRPALPRAGAGSGPARAGGPERAVADPGVGRRALPAVPGGAVPVGRTTGTPSPWTGSTSSATPTTSTRPGCTGGTAGGSSRTRTSPNTTAGPSPMPVTPSGRRSRRTSQDSYGCASLHHQAGPTAKLWSNIPRGSQRFLICRSRVRVGSGKA